MSEHDLREGSKPEMNELLKLEKAATPGPWEAIHDDDGDFAIFRKEWTTLIAVTDADREWDEANAHLIVAMRNQLAAILEEKQRLRDQSADMEVGIPNVPAIVNQAERFSNVATIHAEEALPRILELADSECGGSDEQLISELAQALKNFAEGEIAWREAGTETAELRIRVEAAEAKLGKMRAALRKYGRHDFLCKSRAVKSRADLDKPLNDSKCTCGLVAALAE